MYHFRINGCDLFGWGKTMPQEGLTLGEFFSGNETNRDDCPFPFLPDGQQIPEYAAFCDELGCASYYEVSING